MAKSTSKWKPSLLLPTLFSFLVLKAFVHIVTEDRSHYLPLLFCLDDHIHELNFVLLQIIFSYWCPLCPHKCMNKCCALKKLWSEIPQIWTYTTYSLTAFYHHPVYSSSSLGGIPHQLVDLPDLQETGASTSKTPTVNVGGILLSK